MNNFDMSTDLIRHKIVFKRYLLNQDKIDSIIPQDLDEIEYAFKLREYLDYVIEIDRIAQKRYLMACYSIYKPIMYLLKVSNFKIGEFYRFVNKELNYDINVKNAQKLYNYLKWFEGGNAALFNEDKIMALVKYHNKSNRFNINNIKKLSKHMRNQDNIDYMDLLFAY